MLLHGSGHDGRSLLDPWKSLAQREGLLLVAPNSLNPQVWNIPRDGPTALIRIADVVRKRYSADPRRMYLFGHSGGAVFALWLSVGKPDYFAAIAVHAGAIVGAGPESQLQRAVGIVVRKTPIQIQVGTEDLDFPLAAVRRTADLFRAGGFAIDLREIPGHTHDYYSVSDRINRDAWEFLRGKTLPAEPQ
jgi:predicted peptidase